MVNKNYKYFDITEKIIGCALKIHNKLGNGFQEVIYQRCLEVEFNKAGLVYEREKEMDVYYERVLVGNRRVDFLVEGRVLVELKAVTQMEEVNKAQIINYLEAYNLEVALLINFGAKSLEVKRFINTIRTADHADFNDFTDYI